MRRTPLVANDAHNPEPLTELRRILEAKKELSRAEAEHVRAARTQGYSWLAIADALEVSKQAIHRRYGKK